MLIVSTHKIWVILIKAVSLILYLLSIDEICDKFKDKILLLYSIGKTSQFEELRYSYEVSFTEDVNSIKISSYFACIEFDAK